MGIVLGGNRYGKAETHVVRVVRDTPRHRIRDLVVSTSLHGRFDEAHTTGDQSAVLPTDTQKNTVFAYAKQVGVASPEAFAVALARHFIDDVATVTSARVTVDEHTWTRATVDGDPHDHTFTQTDRAVRTVAVTAGNGHTHVLSGLRDLVLLKSTGSEFHGFLADRYTTLAPTVDRVLATSLASRWRWSAVPDDPDAAYDEIRAILVARFAKVHSLALQQTLWRMGKAVLEARDDIAEIRLSAPNRHHILADLAPFGLPNPGEVFWAQDRPFGLIEVTVANDRHRPVPEAWRDLPGYI
ncbi:factor-independent urate hydroxylase [Rhizohabitans arisaemae]|uniref:factor-independent urate hydroxylase n=1 Tax=Rhizohabitans arisaemae TaxID=2720610 RepID=UPI0024B0EC04|nr:urate oxidase [Rhizohabitans arisaemae]